jgi:hypothetical protein
MGVVTSACKDERGSKMRRRGEMEGEDEMHLVMSVSQTESRLSSCT